MNSRRSPLAMALVVLIGGLVTSAIAAAIWRNVLIDDARAQFLGTSEGVEASVTGRFEDLAAVGRAARGDVVIAGGDLTNASFGELAASAVADLPPGTVASVAYVRPASGDQALDALRTEVRGDGVSRFNIINPAPGQDHFVATFESSASAVPVFDGLDLAGIPAVRSALQVAAIEGRAIASDKFENLPAAAGEAYPSLRSSGVAIAVPVYLDAEAAAAAPRAVDADGWVVVVAAVQDVLDEAVAAEDGGIAAQLEELADPDSPADQGGDLVASTALGDATTAPALERTADETINTSTIERLGQRWELTVADVNGLGGAEAREPWWILGAGAALSVLLAALVWTLGNTRASALAQAEGLAADVRRTEARFEALVQNLPNLIVVTDDENTISYISPSVTSLLGWSVEEALGATLFAMIHPDDRETFARALARRSDGGAPGEARILTSAGHYRWFEGTVTNLFDDPAVAGLVITAHDITAQKAIEDRLAHEATHDSLTRLPNRVIVNDRLDHALDRGRRDGSRAAAIFLDIDEFKLVNDTWGHAAGDELLRQVAQRVQHAARAADTVGRYGGDEFVVICEDLPSAADALLVAERIRDEVVRPAVVDGTEILVGTSIGVALCAGPDEATEALLGRADAAMYEAKATGRGRIVVDAAPAALRDA